MSWVAVVISGLARFLHASLGASVLSEAGLHLTLALAE